MQQTSRRSFLVTGSAASVAALAGCLGNDERDENAPDSDELDWPDWDPANPEWPQPARDVMEAGFSQGDESDLEALETREEPAYGDPPQTPPEDESEFLDPDPIQVSIVPTIDGAAFPDTFEPIAENMEAETGRDVEYVVMNDSAALMEAMRAEQVHWALFDGGSTVQAVNVSGAVPAALGISDDGFGYRFYYIAQKDNTSIHTIDDMRGETVAHGGRTSNSSHLAPKAFMPDQGIVPGEDYEIENTGGHDNVVNGVGLGDYEVGVMASSVFDAMAGADQIDPDDFKIVYGSRLMVAGGGFSHRYNLDPELVADCKRAFTEYDYSGTTIEEEFRLSSFTEIDYATHMDTFIRVAEQNDIDLEL